MNNKYRFISKNKKTANSEVKQDFYIKSYGEFRLDFSGHNDAIQNNNIIRDEFSRTVLQPIIKTEIQENLKHHFKELFKKIENENYNIVNIEMNSINKNKLRTFYSYEVDYISKNADNNIKGVIMGKNIFLNDNLEDFIIKINVNFKINKSLNKFKFIKNKNTGD